MSKLIYSIEDDENILRKIEKILEKKKKVEEEN